MHTLLINHTILATTRHGVTTEVVLQTLLACSAVSLFVLGPHVIQRFYIISQASNFHRIYIFTEYSQ